MMKTFLSVLVALTSLYSFGQVSQGGQPHNWSLKTQTLTVPNQALKGLAKHELETVTKGAFEVGQAFQYGVQRLLDIDVFTDGEWQSLPNGKQICRLAITSPGASMISLQFADFNMEPGAELFLYDAKKKNFLGAFTEANENPGGKWATSVVQGETIIIEYISSPSMIKQPKALKLEGLTHGVLDIFGYGEGGLPKDYWPGYASAGCHNNMVCPIASGWADQGSSVAMFLRPDGAGCTGTMLNNSNNDGTPYFYLANHCYQPTESQWVFYFNYDAPTCSGDTGQTVQTMVGASYRASDYYDDFALVELFNQPPASYNVFLAGWDRSNTTPSSTACILHPAYDVKKFAVDYDVPGQGQGGFGTGVWNTGWESGGIEPVGSGSPLFDNNKRVIGCLTGAWNSCNPGAGGLASKFADQWDGINPNGRLRDWLDPSNTVQAMDGYGGGVVVNPPPTGVAIPLKVALQGPINPSDGRMSDALRSWNVLPAQEPYAALGYQHVNGGGGEVADQDMLNTTGLTAPVDWVFVELRDANNWSVVVATRSGMVLSDGQVVEPDDLTPLVFNVSADDYFIGIKHRNHLPILTGNAISISNGMSTLDLSNNSVPLFGGLNAVVQTGAIWSMYAGDISGDGSLKYLGADNDRDLILVAVGGAVPTNTAFGYFEADTNLDAFVKYAGGTNDRDPILVNLGGNNPTNVRNSYYP